MPEIDQEAKYKRLVQTSVVNFLYVGDEYLFLKRGPHKRIDPGKLNGIGGRLEPGEDYVRAAIRETEEETGYIVTPNDLSFAGVMKLQGGYEEDWVMCYFIIRVPTKDIPLGSKTEDGELIWIHKDQVLDSNYELIDDLRFCWKELTEGQQLLFMTAIMNSEEKVDTISISSLKQKH